MDTCKCGVNEDEHGWGDPPHAFVSQSYPHGDGDEMEEGCGYSYDHDFPPPEYEDGVAALVCRECGAEIFVDEDE
jgi:hypothetical protein